MYMTRPGECSTAEMRASYAHSQSVCILCSPLNLACVSLAQDAKVVPPDPYCMHVQKPDSSHLRVSLPLCSMEDGQARRACSGSM